MKRLFSPSVFISLLTTFVVVFMPYPTFAEEEEHINIVDQIEATSEGSVKISMSDDLKELLDFFVPHVHKKNSGVKRKNNQGYRIQVFNDGQNQRTLKARAQARANTVLARFPKYRGQVYVFSKTPKWYCRIGNFATKEQAQRAVEELRRAFPQFSGEIMAVQSTIVVK